MKIHKLKDFKRGWVVGNFEPSLHKGDFEVGIHSYPSGTHHPLHYHKEATEINIVTEGSCNFVHIEPDNATSRIFVEGDIIVVDPNDVVAFKAITDCKLTVIKTKSVEDDKYLYGN